MQENIKKDCECLAGCPFFNDKMTDMPDIAEILKMHYCRADNRQCARYMVFCELGRDNVPADLFPNHYIRARDIIIAAHKKED
ncbi:MAG: hypothetical protein EHM28_02410 [Spirochaetaceae bacterium]|nr:MAG: hypothetical protein EHM28_02410 [Spirochaetaceae bacterium]